MNLINYLNNNYFTKQELLDLAKVTEEELLNFQQQNVMPKCSYKLKLNYTNHSFFGEFNDQSEIEYYAKGYLSWLGILKTTEDLHTVFGIFAQRYIKAIAWLKHAGYYSDDNTVNSGLDLHIKQEWKSFLEGIYGLCTHSGLPEDIAAKEVAILQINEMLALDEAEIDLTKLTKAVNLLDESSAMFAPHERIKSSRHRLVDEVRRQYKLKS
ncbi:DUF6058 family natural product biosynthesis protein [Shewanella sp. D64]|uniref:DUF6058 family natural product biosynthesis protein n=1 Tax=unclassified Shewanella TaxID=196818 RepID=UPI0022BA1AE1|nr:MULTISPECIES: DUF6058 family natural product biosynthesis protein [unclassified Shewanella]MEC4724377.1 DUF6058 family natural product biosynthesis protein [Shewanella sp. D64]MEC4738889.1 DUF6058 family natural product biosynthesis protein [Shewanella sp. E94]WBJ97674.1 DUF6058 family natural product biosynthesis protein [Shewanella sp. MTB7]